MITTIIPTYLRRPVMLKRAIESVLNQTYEDFQVCVYDNCSGDETAHVPAQLMQGEDRIKYHCHTENIGGLRILTTECDKLTPHLFNSVG